MQKAKVVWQKLNIAFLTTRAVWGSQSGGHGLNHLLENYTESVTNVWPKFGGFLLGWGAMCARGNNYVVYG